MASTWGTSWGTSWATSWDRAVVTPPAPAPDQGGSGKPSRGVRRRKGQLTLKAFLAQQVRRDEERERKKAKTRAAEERLIEARAALEADEALRQLPPAISVVEPALRKIAPAIPVVTAKAGELLAPGRIIDAETGKIIEVTDEEFMILLLMAD